MPDDPIIMKPAPKAPEPLIALPGSDDQGRGYTIGMWHGHFNFECLTCEYATLWEEKMIAHMAEGLHPWTSPGKKTTPDDGDDNLSY